MAQEVNPLGEEIRRENQRLPAQRKYGAVVTDTLESLIGKIGKTPAYVVDESELGHVFDLPCRKDTDFSAKMTTFVP